MSDLLRSFKVHGKGSDKYDNVRVGVNSRLDTIQAAVLNVKLTAFVEHELDDVNRVAEVYSEKLNGLVQTPCVPKGYLSSYAQYTIKCNNSIERNRLQNDLKNNGIPSMIYYAKPLHAQKAFLDQRRDNYYECDVTNQLCETVLSLPMHPYLSNDDIQKVVDVVHSSIIR